MSTLHVAPIQTVWQCRFSRRGYRVPGVPDQLQPETQWVCARSERRNLQPEECERCPYWEPRSMR